MWTPKTPPTTSIYLAFTLSWHVHRPTRIVSFKKKRKLLPNVSICLESKADSSMHSLSPLSQDSNQNQHENKFFFFKFESMEHKLKFWSFVSFVFSKICILRACIQTSFGKFSIFSKIYNSANLHSNFSLEILFLLQTSVILLTCIQTSFWKFFVLGSKDM